MLLSKYSPFFLFSLNQFDFIQGDNKRKGFNFINNISQGMGSYYMNNFRDIKIKFIEKLAYKRRDYIVLMRIISEYYNTNYRLFRMGVVESPACNCSFPPYLE